MKLQRLEMFGFKSFADRVTIEFNPGITAIVGPNGCGKSNISDAIRWVLGEQRPTLMRSSHMDEVIFNGSRDRKPINLAEATVHFSNDDGILPVDYAEVGITRRVFRDGTSEYLLNRQACRLKDIQDLILGTGVGAHAYSLIQQGMVDSLLSERAEERRAIFEEAAGVTRYKTRRRAAERKLEATSQDLARVEDIVGEVERKVTALKRQVGRARRHAAYREEETRLDIHATALRMAALEARLEPLGDELKALEEAQAAQAARLAEREAGHEALELELIEAREESDRLRSEVEEARRQVARREESLLVTGESLKHHHRRLEALSAEAERARTRSDDLAERRANLDVDLRSARERLQALTARRDSETGPGDEERRDAELRTDRGVLVGEAEALRERLAEARQALARQASARESGEQRLAVLSRERDERRREEKKARTTVRRARETVERTAAVRAAAALARADLEAALAEAETGITRARERLARERAAEHAAAGRADTLAAMEARFEGYAGGARALLEGRADGSGILGALTQAIEPLDGRFEPALDRYLESLGHGLLARDLPAARQAADALVGAGRADFLIPELLPAPPPGLSDAAAAVVIARGSDAVRWRSDDLRRRFAPLFDRLLLVADADAAFRCRAALEETGTGGSFVIAGMDGTLLEPIGRWRSAGSDVDEGLLARRRQLVEARAERERRLRSIAAASHLCTAAERELRARRLALAGATERLSDAEARHRAAREALALGEQQGAHVARRLQELAAQIEDQQRLRDTAEAAERTIEETRLEIEADLGMVDRRLEDIRAALERYDQSRAERLSARHAIELEVAEAEAELKAVDREIEHVSAAEQTLDAARTERSAERARLEQECERLEEEKHATAAEIETLNDALDGTQVGLRARLEAARDTEERRARFEAELKVLRREHAETVERRHQRQLARQEFEHERGTLRAHLAETYAGETDVTALAARVPLADGEQELDLEGLTVRLEEVRRKLANLGPVNMLALEEFEEESARLEFLTLQRDDLVAARRQLEEAIRVINRTARELFVRTFDQVRANFDATFKTLFEGGHADVLLADPEDPLESPIEIVASPRGKRIATINLLSGGERALTALSLLFAIYRVKPSPFCILDEVDAPLDDANVGRFVNMIRHFCGDTQFIVVTHNKRTMEAADYLYGVTMEEPGVSALVSVSLEREKVPAAEAGEPDSEARAERALVMAG
ncbi:MAG TPA: chromosome segregation protein SMC [Gemmatimonadota bacterium]|nr:chromosome segregation protein SMC [Gemmatimonadota bacterium]